MLIADVLALNHLKVLFALTLGLKGVVLNCQIMQKDQSQQGENNSYAFTVSSRGIKKQHALLVKLS